MPSLYWPTNKLKLQKNYFSFVIPQKNLRENIYDIDIK